MINQKSKWCFLAAGFALTAVVLLSGCHSTKEYECPDSLGCVSIAPNEPVHIGVLQVLSGGLKDQGMMSVNGVKLALAEKNNQILGHPVELHTMDSRCSAEGGVNAALALTINSKIVGIIGTYCSGAAKAAVPQISGEGMVMISGTNSAPSLTSINNEPGENWFPGYYRTMYNGIKMAEMAAVFAFQELGFSRASTINDGDAFTKELTTEFERQFKKLGGAIVQSVGINKGDTDMKPALETLAYAKPEIIYFPLFQPEAVRVITQAKKIPGLEKTVLIGEGGASSETFLNAIGTSGLGLYLTTVKKISNKKLDTLFLDYEKSFNQKPIHFSLPYVYDAAGLLIFAIESSAVKEPDGTLHIGRGSLRKALYETIAFEGTTGSLTCDKFGDFFSGLYSMIRLDDLSAGLKGFQANSVFEYK